MIDLRPLAAADPLQIESLLDTAFGSDRRERTAYRLREGLSPIGALSFAACVGERLAGVLQSWPVLLKSDGGARHKLVLVGPVAVDPARQQGGLGKRMMEALIEGAAATQAPPLMLVGDPEYYERFFGFTAAATGGWSLPGPFESRRLLARLPADAPEAVVGRIVADLSAATFAPAERIA